MIHFLSLRSVKALLLVATMFYVNNAAGQNKKVLFIGNSLTYFNNMPQTVKSVSAALGDSIDVTVYAPGGTGFVNHVSDPAVYQYFRQGGWDYIVLQPGSNESPAFSASIDTTIARGKILLDSARLYNPCAHILLYEISYGVAAAGGQANTNYFYAQSLIKNNLIRMSDSLHCAIVPAGETMRNIWSRDTSFLIWNSYGDIHPNSYGSYAIACSFAAAIVKKSVTGLSIYNGLDSAKCKLYQRIADSIVFATPMQWRLGAYEPYAQFGYSVSNAAISFNNRSQHYDQLLWEYGDGTTDTLANPVKTYAYPGTYLVKLHAFWQNCADDYDTVIVVKNAAGLSQVISQHSLLLYPNPSHARVYLDAPDATVWKLQLFDVSGRCVLSSGLSNSGISIDHLPSGAYWYRLTGQSAFEQGKLIIQH